VTSVTDFYEYETCNTIDEVKAAELGSIDYDTPVYETADFKVVPTIALTLAGEPIVKYGIFNKRTNVMEAEASQIVTARSWCNALTEAEHKVESEREMPDLPGLTPGGGVH